MVPEADSWSPERIREEIEDRRETIRELKQALAKVYEDGPYTDPITAAQLIGYKSPSDIPIDRLRKEVDYLKSIL
jgi:hypothetical protein